MYFHKKRLFIELVTRRLSCLKRKKKSSRHQILANRRAQDLESSKRKKHKKHQHRHDRRRWGFSVMKLRYKIVKSYRHLRSVHRVRDASRIAGECFKCSAGSVLHYDRLYKSGGKRGLLPKYQQLSRSPTTPFLIIQIILLLRAHLGWGGLRISKELSARGIYEISHMGIYKLFDRYHVKTKTYHPKGKSNGIAYKRYEKKVPNELWHVDLAGPFETPDGEKLWVIIIIDDHSRYLIDVQVLTSLQTKPIIKILESCFEIMGKPKAIMTDNAPTFVPVWQDAKHQFTLFLHKQDIEHKTIPPYYPEANGKAEAMVKITKNEAIYPFLGKNKQWDKDALQNALNQFRNYYNQNRLHGGIGWVTPHEKFTNVKPNLGGLNSIYNLENINVSNA